MNKIKLNWCRITAVEKSYLIAPMRIEPKVSGLLYQRSNYWDVTVAQRGIISNPRKRYEELCICVQDEVGLTQTIV